MNKKQIVFLTCLLLMLTISSASSSAGAAEPVAMKWHPGHYLTYTYGDNINSNLAQLSENSYRNIAGVKVKIHWGFLEDGPGDIQFDVIDAMLAALPEDKVLMPLILDRDFHNLCNKARLPNYVVNHPQYPAMAFDGGKGCVPQVWEPVINDLKIAFYQKLGAHYDLNPRFEGIILEETALNLPSSVYSKNDLRDEYIRFHTEVRPAMPHTHLFQGMNWLGGEHRCDNLRQLAEHFKNNTGSGISNPDTVPWRAQPAPGDDCTKKYYGEIADDVPVYHLYRDYKGTLPIAVGNDTSQLGDPTKPATFNGKSMTMPNLVESVYLMSTKGFSLDGDWIEGFGTNYMLWNGNFWSIEGGSQSGWVDAVLDFINQPGHEVDTSCPSAIICQSAGPAPTFSDVPFNHPYREEIEVLYQAGYTAGCDTEPLRFCPDDPMERSHAAVFVVRGEHGRDFEPVLPADSSFADVDLASWHASWVHQLYSDGFIAGCGTDPLTFCPDQGHTRAETAVFGLRMKFGQDYVPPAAKGLFGDLPAGFWGTDWAEAAYVAGLIPACDENGAMFCPNEMASGLAAFMVVEAKGLGSGD